MLEAGEGQAEKIVELADHSGSYRAHAVTRDYAGIQRVVALQLSAD
jgi:methylase of polypeptide subunit release factors